MILALVCRRTPAAVPGDVLSLIDVSPVALGWPSVVMRGSRVVVQPALFGCGFAQANTFRRFFLEVLRHRGRAALAADAAHPQCASYRALPQHDGVTDFHFASRLGFLVVDVNAPLVDLFNSQ